MTDGGRVRVLVAKPGLDGHDRGAQVIARALMDAGMEVVYTGIRQTAEMIVEAAAQEDVDCVGLSMLSGSHVEHTEDVIKGLEAAGAGDVKVFVGGIIPAVDHERLNALGVAGIFGPGSTTEEIIAAVARACPGKTVGPREA